MTEPTPVYFPARQISARIVDGQLIILRPGNDELLRFNEVATFIWSILEKKATDTETLVQAIVMEFEVELEQARLDLTSFLAEMTSQGLLETEPIS